MPGLSLTHLKQDTSALLRGRSRHRENALRQEAPPLGLRQHSAPEVLTQSSKPMVDTAAIVGETRDIFHEKPNLGAHTFAAGARNAQIASLAKKLKTEVTPVGLYGINYGAAIGAGLATAISFGISFLTLISPVIPGLGVGLFAGLFLASTLIGAIVQWRARRTNMERPEVKLLAQQLDQFEQELLAIPLDVRTGADLRDLRQIQALKVHMSWTFKQGLRQMGYGLLGTQQYAKTEAFFYAQYRKMAALGQSNKALVQPSTASTSVLS